MHDIVIVIKKVGWGLRQLMGATHNRTRAQALQKESLLLT